MLRIARKAPEWSGVGVHAGEFREMNSEQFPGWLLMLFYPLDFTFVCPTELLEYSARITEFQGLKCSVVGVSVDSKHSHLQWLNTPRRLGGLEGLQFPLVSDITKKISTDFKVLDHDAGTAFRGTFLIDPKRNLRHCSVNDLGTFNDAGVGRSADETLRLLEAFQFHDEHGEVCPASWTRGKPTMMETQESLKSYFAGKKE